MVTLPGDAVERYARFSLYNSPYPAHDRGCAVDLYPETDAAPSPVAGEVILTRTVDCPPRPYAVDHDHLIVIDTGTHLARILHVEPAVESGDRVRVGEPLGDTIRSGFFAPWVDDHVHLGFRDRDANPVRASGSLPLDLGLDLEPVPWDGAGVVRAVGETYAVLDVPDHPAPGDRFAGIAADGAGVLDGGLPHYANGGLLRGGREPARDDRRAGRDGPVSLLGTRIGRVDGRTVTWDGVAVRANGEPVHGLSLFCGRDDVAVKLVCPDLPLAEGDRVRVDVVPEEGKG